MGSYDRFDEPRLLEAMHQEQQDVRTVQEINATYQEEERRKIIHQGLKDLGPVLGDGGPVIQPEKVPQSAKIHDIGSVPVSAAQVIRDPIQMPANIRIAG